MSDPKRPLKEHIEELSVRLRRCVFILIASCAIGYFLNAELLDWILGPLKEHLPENASVVYTKPFEKIWVYIRVSMIFGILFALPFFLLEGFQFVNPAFKSNHKSHFFWLLLFTTGAFSSGIYVGKEFALPAVLDAAFRFGSQEIAPFLTLSAYVDTASAILLACALFFEIPIFMFFLGLWDFVQPSTWRKGRRIAIVINAILGAFLSPPDPLSMLVLMLPLVLLYEGGIVLSYLGSRMKAQT